MSDLAVLERPRISTCFEDSAMCPACFATIAAIASSTTAAGGIVAFVVSKVRVEHGAVPIPPISETHENLVQVTMKRQEQEDSALAE